MKGIAVGIGLMLVAGSAWSDPWIKPFTDIFKEAVLEGVAEGKGGLGDAARRQLDQEKERKAVEAGKAHRRSLNDCIKPGNVIDDDVQECMQGRRAKTW